MPLTLRLRNSSSVSVPSLHNKTRQKIRQAHGPTKVLYATAAEQMTTNHAITQAVIDSLAEFSHNIGSLLTPADALPAPSSPSPSFSVPAPIPSIPSDDYSSSSTSDSAANWASLGLDINAFSPGPNPNTIPNTLTDDMDTSEEFASPSTYNGDVFRTESAMYLPLTYNYPKANSLDDAVSVFGRLGHDHPDDQPERLLRLKRQISSALSEQDLPSNIKEFYRGSGAHLRDAYPVISGIAKYTCYLSTLRELEVDGWNRISKETLDTVGWVTMSAITSFKELQAMHRELRGDLLPIESCK